MHNDGHFNGQFHQLRYLNHLFVESFDLVNAGNFVVDNDDLLDDGGDFGDAFLDLCNWHVFLNSHFLEGFLHIGYYLFDLLNHLSHNGLLNN